MGVKITQQVRIAYHVLQYNVFEYKSRGIMHLKNLAKLRKQKGLTQEGLARKADISYHTIIKLEGGGIKNPKIETVIKLADALKVKLEEIIGR